MDMLSIFLAKLFGVVFFIVGLFFLLRTHALKASLLEFGKSHALITITAICRLFAGLAIIYVHNVFDFSWHLIITLIGYLFLITGIGRLFWQKKVMSYMTKVAANESLIKVMGIILLIVGAFLAYYGFWAI